LHPLDRKTLRSILTEPKNSIIKQYTKLFEMDDVTLIFEEEALDYIVDKAVEFKLGARGLRSICEAIMVDVMFEQPSTEEKQYTITAGYAKTKVEKINLHRLKAA
jgi:ATP-dependent Clp protease ATP-binding subunit ClpX